MKFTLFALFFLAALTSCFAQASYLMHRAAQAEACAHLPDDQISDCTDSLIYNEIYRAIDISACHNQDSTVSYTFRFAIDAKGKVTNSDVKESYKKGPICLNYFQKKANDIMKNIPFTPAQNKSGQAIQSQKRFSVSYPHTEEMDSILAEHERFRIVEQMPRFTGCEHIIGNSLDKQQCADGQLLQFLYSNLSYPREARENGVEGKVFVQFVVEKNGMLDSINVIRDIGAGCGTASALAIEKMNELNPPFIPGKQNGKDVRVLYTMPVTFKLEGKKKRRKRR